MKHQRVEKTQLFRKCVFDPIALCFLILHVQTKESSGVRLSSPENPTSLALSNVELGRSENMSIFATLKAWTQSPDGFRDPKLRLRLRWTKANKPAKFQKYLRWSKKPGPPPFKKWPFDGTNTNRSWYTNQL